MLYKANSYQTAFGWRLGKTHQVDAENSKRVMCGKLIAEFPGDEVNEGNSEVDCKSCLNAIESRRKNKEWQIKWQIESQQRTIERERQNAEWWQWYNSYLQTPQWKEKKRLVIRRANNICEGCGLRTAIQVHHLTYERVGNEMLFDLVAICLQCHDSIHEKDEERHGHHAE